MGEEAEGEEEKEEKEEEEEEEEKRRRRRKRRRRKKEEEEEKEGEEGRKRKDELSFCSFVQLLNSKSFNLYIKKTKNRRCLTFLRKLWNRDDEGVILTIG